ncbi:MAG: hypothetical protein ACTSV9_08050 [Candidatus Thorarchaeota archaeon]
MIRKSKKWKQPASDNLEDVEFNPSGLDLKWSKNLTTTIDAYRIYRCYDLGSIERAIGKGKMPRSFVKQWRMIRSVLHRFAAVTPKIPSIEKMMMRRQILQFSALILVTIGVPAIVLTFILRLDDIAWFTYPLGFFAGAMFAVTALITAAYNRKIAWTIFHYIEDHPDLLKAEKARLHEWSQKLIRYTGRLVRKDGLDLDKNLLKLYSNDYDGVTFIKEPSRFRKHYVARYNP